MQIKQDKIRLEQITEKLKKQNEVLIEKEKVLEQKILDITMQSAKPSETSSEDFKPDPNNKDNLQILFLEKDLIKKQILGS